MSKQRLIRLCTTLSVLTLGMLIGANVSWALTALVCVALGLAIAFSIALVRMEEDRDKWRAVANLHNLEPWQVQWLDRVMDPDYPDVSAVLREGRRKPRGPYRLSKTPLPPDHYDKD